jgi:hypothetical protein
LRDVVWKRSNRNFHFAALFSVARKAKPGQGAVVREKLVNVQSRKAPERYHAAANAAWTATFAAAIAAAMNGRGVATTTLELGAFIVGLPPIHATLTAYSVPTSIECEFCSLFSFDSVAERSNACIRLRNLPISLMASCRRCPGGMSRTAAVN